MRRTQCAVSSWVAFAARLACFLLLLGSSSAFAQNTPPTVALTSPANGDSFFAPASINLAATASDPNGSVVRVDFFQGATLVATSTAAPFAAVWSNVAVGNYTLTARATDNAGATATSAPVSITVNAQNALVITSPADGGAASIAGAFTVAGTFVGPAGSSVLVDNQDSVISATVSGTSFTATYPSQGLAIGPNAITAKLQRPDGTTASRSITVQGYDTPVLAFTAPSLATFGAPATVTFAVDAVAPGGTVAKVDFLRNGTPVGTVLTPPYQVTLTGLGTGTYTITANATSSFGPVGSASRTISVQGANTPPSISISSPSEGAIFPAPASIPIAVNAADPDGTVTLVQYFANGALIGASSVSPFGFTWTNVAAGSYALTARATDNQGAATTSTPVNVTVRANTPPSIGITSPTTGATFTVGSNVPVAVNASDPDGTVTLVQYFANGAPIGSSSTAPFGITWSNVQAGSYALTATATDNQGASTTSAPVNVTVSAHVPPTVSIIAPAQNASFLAPGTVLLAANAAASQGALTKVEYYQGATLIGTSTTPPYSFVWSVTAPGSYVLTAKAYDDGGGITASAPVTISVRSSVVYRHNDFAGNPVAATDFNGALIWKENFRPYGARLNNQPAAAGNRQWFHGKPADADTGLSYLGARYYDPTLGRFMGMDPVGVIEGSIPTFNRYSFGANNPYKYTDADGRFFWFLIAALAALTPEEAAVVGVVVAGGAVYSAQQQQKKGGRTLANSNEGDPSSNAPSGNGSGSDNAGSGSESGKDVTKRPGRVRKGTEEKNWENAENGPDGGKVCPTCGDEVKSKPGEKNKDWDNDHNPPWRNRDLTGKDRKGVLDEYNKDTRLRCVHCNRGDTRDTTSNGGNN